MNCLEQEIIRHVKRASGIVYSTKPVDPVHPIGHTGRVVANTLNICRGDRAALFEPVAAAWLHDYGRPAAYQASLHGIKLNHAEESARHVPVILHPFRDSLGKGRIQEIQIAVAVHSRLNSPDDSLTAQILKDADRLDGLGSAGLRRTVTAAHGHPLCNPSSPFPDQRKSYSGVTSQETPLAEMVLYTIEWFPMLRMPAAIGMGLVRVQKQIGFLEGLAEKLGLPASLLEQNEIIKQARARF